MAAPIKLLLSLDPVPALNVITGFERDTNASRPRGTKRKANTALEDHEDGSGRQSSRKKSKKSKSRNDIQSKTKTEIKSEHDAESNEPSLEQIVSFDTGMHGSGLCFASPRTDPALVMAETSFPGSMGRWSKVPSIVAFFEDNPNHPSFENGSRSSFFGFQIPPRAKTRAFYKASSDRNARPSNFDDPILVTVSALKVIQIRQPRENREAAIVALKHLKSYHEVKVKSKIGSSFEQTVFRFVFTHPAACSPQGIEALRDVLRAAGFNDNIGNRPRFLSEAHAAAIAGFVSCRNRNGSEAWKIFFKVGTLVTVIDIGALTVDLTTVRIIRNDPAPNFDEATIPGGGRCGTGAIHCHLMNVLAGRLGKAFLDLPKEDLVPGSDFFASCETVIRTFEYDEARPDQRHYFSLRLGENITDDRYDSDAEEIYLTSEEIKAAMDAYLEYPKGLLLAQWTQPETETVQTTMFCGGGSLIPYVYKELTQFCTSNDIQSMQAEDPESAVCRGAVISQMQQKLYGRRRSRAGFGIEVTQGGRQYIKWFLVRGEQLDASEEETVIKDLDGYVFITHAQILDPEQSFEIPVLMYEKDEVRPSSADDPDVQRISTIVITPVAMSDYLRRKLRRQMNDASTTQTHLAVKVTMLMDSSARLFFEAKHGNCGLGRGELRLDETLPVL